MANAVQPVQKILACFFESLIDQMYGHVIIVHNDSPPLLKLAKTYDLTFDPRLVANNNDEPRCIQKAPSWFQAYKIHRLSVKNPKITERINYNLGDSLISDQVKAEHTVLSVKSN